MTIKTETIVTCSWCDEDISREYKSIQVFSVKPYGHGVEGMGYYEKKKIELCDECFSVMQTAIVKAANETKSSPVDG